MPTNNFKLFDENKANLLTDTEYANATQRLNGVQTGVASSQLNNKFAYQVSLVAYSIAQLMNANGLDASDTLAVSAFVGNLQGALLQKVADKATTAEAAAGVLSNKYITPETMKAAALLLSGGVMSGMLDMGNNRITNLGTPTADSDAVTKAYVDGNTAFKIKELGTITAVGQQVPITFDDLVKFKALLIEFHADILTKTSPMSQRIVSAYLYFHGYRTNSIQVYEYDTPDESITEYNDVNSTLMITKISFTRSGNIGTLSLNYGYRYYLETLLNEGGYFSFDSITVSGLNCKISLLM